MSEFKKFGPLIDEKGLGWVFSASSIPTPIQEQVKDWFYYRRINDTSEDKFQRMFKRKLYAVEPRFLALMSAQAMEIDPLVQEMFEATVAATREGKTVVNETGTETATGEGSNTQHRTGNNTSNTTTTGESSGTSKVTANSDVSGNESTTHTIDENGSDNTTHTGGEARADSAYPESALSTPGPLPTPDTITLTHLANMTVNNRNSHDGTLTVRKGNNKDEGTRSSHTEGTTNGETTGRTSGSSEGTVVTSEDITGSNTSNNSITRGRDSTTTNDGKDSSTTTNKGRHMSAQELLSKYLDFIYRCDAILWFVNEMEGCFLAVYDDSGVDCFVWDGDGEAGKDGKDGVTFVPHVQKLSNGVRIYWTNDGGQPNPSPVEITNGEDGRPGTPGPVGPEGPAGEAGVNGATFTPVVTSIEGGYRLSWENDKGLTNPDPIDILNGTGGGGGVPVGSPNSVYASDGTENYFGSASGCSVNSSTWQVMSIRVGKLWAGSIRAVEATSLNTSFSVRIIDENTTISLFGVTYHRYKLNNMYGGQYFEITINDGTVDKKVKAKNSRYETVYRLEDGFFIAGDKLFVEDGKTIKQITYGTFHMSFENAGSQACSVTVPKISTLEELEDNYESYNQDP